MTPHLLPQTDGTVAEFQYYFGQREALETIIYLYDVVGVQDKFDMMRFQVGDIADRRVGRSPERSQAMPSVAKEVCPKRQDRCAKVLLA